MKKIALFLALFLVFGVSQGWAVCGVDDWVNGKANSENYWVKTGGMFLRGLHRIVESPIELGYYTYKGTKDELGYGEGVLKGLGRGVGWMADDIVRGAWDVITAVFPDYHGEPGIHNLGDILHGKAEATATATT